LDFSVHALWGGDHRPPLYDCQTRTVWSKNIKIETTAETKTYISDALEVRWNIQKIIFKVNYPFKLIKDTVTTVKKKNSVKKYILNFIFIKKSWRKSTMVFSEMWSSTIIIIHVSWASIHHFWRIMWHWRLE